jgi:4-hydroxy-tetrahydrodipicolinate synthase
MSLNNNYHIAVPTSFNEQEELNIDATLQHIQYLIHQGVQSILMCGSTGEQHSLTLNEKFALVEGISSLEISSDFELLFGVSSIRQAEAKQLALKISKTPQINAILLGYSPYVLPTQKEALHYATSIIEAANKQAIIYNNPLRTGFDLAIESFKRLANNDLVIGLKEAGKPNKVLELKESIDKPLFYFAGGEKELEKKISLGYNGLSSIAGNLYPNEIRQWFDAVLVNEVNQDYTSLENKIAEIYQDSPLPFLKNEISRREGISFGICRSPLGN